MSMGNQARHSCTPGKYFNCVTAVLSTACGSTRADLRVAAVAAAAPFVSAHHSTVFTAPDLPTAGAGAVGCGGREARSAHVVPVDLGLLTLKTT